MATEPSDLPKTAVVGCGYWGKNLVRNFHQLGVLAGVCDENSTQADAAAAQYGVPVLTLAEVLNNPSIAGVVVAAPAALHYRIASEAIARGKHVFVEKPLALAVADANALLRQAEAAGTVLMVGHLLRYHPAFLKIHQMCAGGLLGRLHYVYSHRLNLGKFRTEENILWSFAPHDISMILALLGDNIETVHATGHAFLHKTVADVTTTHITFANGAAAHIHVSWLHPFKEQRLVVVGEDGMLVFDDSLGWVDKVKHYPHRVIWRNNAPLPEKAEAIAIELESAEPLRLECQHFLDCIRDHRRPVTDGREGVAVLSVLDASQRSLETGATIRLDAAAKPPIRDWFAHETAAIDEPSTIGAGTKIWHFTHVLKNSTIGEGCNIGQNVVIGPDVTIGKSCKIQNNVSIYTGVTLEDGVFCGPSMVFTNVTNPRAEINRKSEYRPTLVRRGATIGANATIVCGHTVGRYALIGAGAVVTRDVPDFALMVGNPARRIGWVCACGERLPEDDWTECCCSACALRYSREGNVVSRAD